MRNFKLLLVSCVVLLTVISCKKDNPLGEGYLITFTPDQYTVSGVGGEVITAVADHEFKLNFSSIALRETYNPIYDADKNGDFIETDFFTAERMPDYRVKFTVQPNTTGKEREYVTEVVWEPDGRGFIYLTQTVE